MDPDLLAEDQGACEPLCPLSEGLPPLRTVYAGEADPHLPLRRGENRDRVPVGHPDAAAGEGLRSGGCNEDGEEECD